MACGLELVLEELVGLPDRFLVLMHPAWCLYAKP